jgi:hypothetical protein
MLSLIVPVRATMVGQRPPHFLLTNCVYKYKLVYTCIYKYTLLTSTLYFNQALSALRHRRVSTPRTPVCCSRRAFFFLSIVSSTLRPLRQGLPRPNCQGQGFNSYTLLPRLPSTAAVSAQHIANPESFKVGWLELSCRRGTRA